jgi:leucyl aminopeptidase
MGCILGVARGSSEEPKLVIMEYLGGTKGNPKGKKKIAVVGKGITFDSGGINLKPTGYIENMKDDKAGAAVVLGLMKILPKLGVKHHVIGVMPLTENMPGQSAQKPGDILTAYNKKTIEVVNTDAEGRLILADALSYVEKNYKPDAIIDLATLTGACIVALGYFAAGMLGTDEALIKKITLTGEKTGERVWELPFWDDYRELVKGDIADVNNSIKGAKYTPGTITGAAFISNFVEKTPWVHLDIAGPAWLESDSDYVPRGGTGYGVRLLSQLLVDWN